MFVALGARSQDDRQKPNLDCVFVKTTLIFVVITLTYLLDNRLPHEFDKSHDLINGRVLDAHFRAGCVAPQVCPCGFLGLGRHLRSTPA